MIIESSTPRKRRTALACAAVLAGVTAVVGVGAAPVAARPDYGAVPLRQPVAPDTTCGANETPQAPAKDTSKDTSKDTLAGDVHVDRGTLLR